MKTRGTFSVSLRQTDPQKVALLITNLHVLEEVFSETSGVKGP
jgi:hypothetical protein